MMMKMPWWFVCHVKPLGKGFWRDLGLQSALPHGAHILAKLSPCGFTLHPSTYDVFSLNFFLSLFLCLYY
jgi:hypothetical protein